MSEAKTIKAIKSALFGVAVGDALGVPVEFSSRQTLRINPVTDMIGYGTYNLPEELGQTTVHFLFALPKH